MASSPVASGADREVLESGLGGVQHGQEHELLRRRKGNDKGSRNRAGRLVGYTSQGVRNQVWQPPMDRILLWAGPGG